MISCGGEAEFLRKVLFVGITFCNLQVDRPTTSSYELGKYCLKTIATEEICPDAMLCGRGAEESP